MADSPIKTIGVIGTGVIGSSWTLFFLSRGLNVIVSDPAPGAREKLAEYLEYEWSTMQKMGLHEVASLGNYRFVENIIDYLGDIDLVQENGPERVDFKRQLFSEIDAKAPRDVLLVSSSSGIPSSEFVTDCKINPARVMVGHPFNPPHLVPLVEVVPHPGTGEVYANRAMDFYRHLGKTPVFIKQETPGFIANRLQWALCTEAYSLVARGIISAEDLDATVTSGLGLRWSLTGPFMTNILGGGGSLRHLLEHIGTAANVWTEDMKKHAFQLTPENIDILDSGVQSWTQKIHLKSLEKNRDEALMELIAVKSRALSLE